MEETLVQLPVVSAAMHGIEVAVAEEGGSLMFANIPRGERLPAFLAERQVDGVIVKGPNVGLLPSAHDNELLRRIYELPHVWLLGQLPNAKGDHCNFDQELVGQLAAEHLRSKGHVHVAFLNPKPGHAQFERVKRAFCAATQTFGHRADILEPTAPVNLTWPLPAVSADDKVNKLVLQWAAAKPAQRATAIAVGADTTAVQMYAAFARLRIRVGRDVGVISCNDERSLIMGLHPALTTIDVRADAIGRSAVARLLWRVTHRGDEASARTLIEPRLIERDSVPRLR
jgi:DNA-binding LacI/PurR family transcriptional regulator